MSVIERIVCAIEPLIRHGQPIYDLDAREIAKAALSALSEELDEKALEVADYDFYDKADVEYEGTMIINRKEALRSSIKAYLKTISEEAA